MASGHVNRINRPNTWLLRPGLRREESPCQHGAVHTWHPCPSLASSRQELDAWLPCDLTDKTQKRAEAALFLAQPRFAHAFQETLHQLGRLVGNVGPDPGDRQLRLLVTHHCQERPGLIDTPRLCQACAAQTLRPLEARTQAQCFERASTASAYRPAVKCATAIAPRKSAISGSSGLSLIASSPCSMASRSRPANA